MEIRTNREELREFTLNLMRGDREYIEAFQQMLPSSQNDPAFNQKMKLVNEVVDNWLDLSGLKGFREKTKKIFTPQDYNKIITALIHSPFKLEDSLELLQQKFDIKFTPEFQKMLIEEVQEKQDFQKFLDKLKAFNIPAIALGIILKKLPKPSTLVKITSNALFASAGITSTIDLYRKSMTLSDFNIRNFQDLDTYLDVLGITGGVVGLFSKFKNPLFSLKTLDEKIDTSIPFIENVIKAKRNVSKRIAELQNATDKNPLQELMPIISFADNLSPDFSKILHHAVSNTDDLRITRALLDDETLDKLIKGQKVPELSRLISQKYLEKLFSTYDIQKIKVFVDDQLIKETQTFSETFSVVDDLLKKQKTARLEILTDKYTFTREFIPDYIPTYTKSAIVKFADKNNEIRTAFVDEISLPEFIAKLQAENLELKGIIAPSIQKMHTSKFTREVINKLKDKLIEYNDINTFIENAEDDLKNILRQAKEEVFTYAKTTERGFIEKALKLKGEEFAKEFLKINILQRVSNPIPLLHLKSQLEAIKELSPPLARLRRIIEYITSPPEMKSIKEANSAFKRLWLFANLPVSLLNSLLNPLFITALNLSAKNKIDELIPFASKFLKNMFRGENLKESIKMIQKEPEMSLMDLISGTIKIPFTSIVNAYKQTLLEEGGKLSELIFGTKNVDDEILKTFLFSEGALAHPTFFSVGKIGPWIENLSAFFVANYVPFFYSLKAIWDTYFTSMNLRGMKKISPFLALAGTTTAIGTLIGFRQTTLMGMIENALQVGDVIASLITPEEESNSPFWEFFMSELGTGASKVGEKFSNALTFAIDSHATSFLPSLLSHIAIGRGLIGWLTNWRTEAASQILPSIVDSPIVQLLTSYNRFYTEIKLREHEIKDPQAVSLALTKSFLNNLGTFNKIAEAVNGKVNSVIHLPPSDFTQALKDIMLPSSLIEKPAFISFFDKRTIEKTLNEGMIGIQFIFANLEKAKEKRGKSFIIQNIDKNIERLERALKEKEKDVEPEHVVFLLLLKHHIKSDKDIDVVATAQKLAKTLDTSPQELAIYIQKLNDKMKLAKQITKFQE